MSGGMGLTTRAVAHVPGFRTATCLHVTGGVGRTAAADSRGNVLPVGPTLAPGIGQLQLCADLSSALTNYGSPVRSHW